jgi:hypothetical protein
MYRWRGLSARGCCGVLARERERETKKGTLWCCAALLDEWIRDVGEDKSEKIKWPAEQKGVE